MEKSSELKVAAVVVTYNRLNLLKRLLESLNSQTRKLNEIIVVNNGSSDGTTDWLLDNPELKVLNQNNLGSAGGQLAGLKYAYEMGYDYVWTMDDDGLAMSTTLENLLNEAFENKVVGSLVYSQENKKELAFETYYTENNKVRIIKNAEDVKKMKESGIFEIRDFACFFNSILIPKNILSVAGYPNPNLFMWGDENEYFARILSYGFEIKTIIDSIYYHPKDRMPLENKKYGLVYTGGDDWKGYLYFRNKAFILKRYNRMGLIKLLISNFVYRLNKPRRLVFFIESIKDGLFQIMTKKIPF